MAQHRCIEHLGIIEHLAHHAAVLDTMAIIGKRNGTGGDHIAHLGKLLAGKPLGAGTKRIDARSARLPGALFEKVLDHGTRVDHGIGVGHGHDAREPPMGGGAHAR